MYIHTYIHIYICIYISIYTWIDTWIRDDGCIIVGDIVTTPSAPRVSGLSCNTKEVLHRGISKLEPPEMAGWNSLHLWEEKASVQF